MRSRWSILAVLFFARVTMAFQYQTVAALAPVISETYGAGLADIGLLIGLYLAPGAIIAIPGGAFAARFGEIRVIWAAFALMLLGGILSGFGGSWEAVLAGRVIAGIGGVAINVLMAKLVVDWFAGREISTAMAIFVNSWPIGIAAALLILPAVALGGGLTAASLITLSIILLAALLFIAHYRVPEGAVAPAVSKTSAPLPFYALVTSGMVWALFNAAAILVVGFGPTLLNARGWTLIEASSITSGFLIAMAISVPLGGIAADRSGRPFTVIYLSLTSFAGLLLFSLVAPAGLVPATIALMGLGAGFCVGPVVAMPSLVLSAETRALGMGVFFAIYYVAMMIVPTIAGWLSERAGDAAVTFQIGAAILVVSIVNLWLFRQRLAASPAAV